MRILIALLSIVAGAAGQPPAEQQKLKTRELQSSPPRTDSQGLWLVPAGTRIPIQLRQPLSTKDARPGDPVYAQTSFPVVNQGNIVIPAGTWVQGVVDSIKRAGRIKGTAELQFHLTSLIYPNGYSLDIAAAIDQVPGNQGSEVKEPGIAKHDPEKGTDLEKIGEAASRGGGIGAIAGSVSGNLRGFGAGGLAGITAGTLIAILRRGADVTFPTGAAVEIALTRAMAIMPEKVGGAK